MDAVTMFCLTIGFFIGCILFAVPSIIAFKRGLQYKWIILVLNLFGFFPILWIASLIWSLLPNASKEKYE